MTGWSRSEERILAEARLDGIYVIRTSLGPEAIAAEAAVLAYKSLAIFAHLAVFRQDCHCRCG